MVVSGILKSFVLSLKGFINGSKNSKLVKIGPGSRQKSPAVEVLHITARAEAERISKDRSQKLNGMCSTDKRPRI